jgi:hypothetical protein
MSDLIWRPSGSPQGLNRSQKCRRKKSYVPLIVLRKSRFLEREQLRDCFAEMVYKVLEPTANAKNAVYYPIIELVENIFEHSCEEKGYAFAQYYPRKRFVDLCITDRGRGIAASYREEKGLDLSDKEALIESLGGLSVKPEKERGYGIRTSKRVVCEGLGGEFVLISGKVAFCASRGEIIYDLSPFCWRGVIVAYRIPRPDKPVDIYPFLE